MVTDAFIEELMIRGVLIIVFEITTFSRKPTIAWHVELPPEIRAKPEFISVTVKGI